MKLIVSCLMAFSIVACSTNSKVETVQYKTSQSYPSLEIPPDLTGLNDSGNKVLPGSIIGTGSAVGRYSETGTLSSQVLPKLSGISLEGEGGTHWIEIKEDITNVYVSLKTFWAEEGFNLEQDEPVIGIMKTEWLENRSGYLSDDDSILNNLFAFFYDTDYRDQYRTRVQRGDAEGVTKVYLTQYGQEFMLTDAGNVEKSSSWQTRAHDPELEVEMLSRMMIFLGLQNADLKEQLAKIGLFSKRAILSSNEDGVRTLILKESLPRGWNRLVTQLSRLDIKDMTSDRDNNEITFKKVVKTKQQEEQGFFANLFGFEREEAKEVEKNVTIILRVVETSVNTTLINVVDSNDVINDSDYANALLQRLYSRLK